MKQGGKGLTRVRFGPGLAANRAALVQMCFALMDSGEGDKAIDLLERALEEEPDDPELLNFQRLLLARGLPDWHLRMLRDQRRNDAYQAAIERTVKPGDHVLEVGSGSGLLAMMAARAGAAHVVTCEMNRAVADTARRIVAANGFADRVTVVAKISSGVNPGDLPRPADIFVSELIDDWMIGDGVLEVVEDVTARLLRPGARIIPEAIEARVALAHLSGNQEHLGQVNGFDVSLFNRHLRAPHPVRADSQRLSLRSRPGSLFAFDLSSGGPFPAGDSQVRFESHGGTVNGVAYWFRLRMDEKGIYENQPGMHSHWAILFHPLLEPVETEPGQAFNVHGSHDRRRVRLWVTMDDEAG